MDMSEDDKFNYSKIRYSNERGHPHKAKVTFQLSPEETDNESDCNESQITETTRFKRKVSELMQDKEAWEEIKKESLKNDFGSVTTHLLKKSSIYAISQVGHAESPFRKILWVLVLIAGLLGCCYEIHSFLVLYFQYPVVINLNVENRKSLEFPAVTICNLNRMKKMYEVCLESDESAKTCKFPHKTRSRNGNFNEKQSTVVTCGLRNNYGTRTAFLAKYNQLDSISRKVFGHQLMDLIQNCSFNGEECSLGYFSYYQSLKYGNCYTFNKFSAEDDTVLKTSTVGIMSGLDMTVNFDPDSYLDVSAGVGARVVIHDPREDPNPEEEGVNIGPGFETTLAIKQTCSSRLPAPYKDQCVVYGENEEVKGNNRNDCVRSCIQEENYARCSCINPTLPRIKDYNYCKMTNLTEVCCLDANLKAMAIKGLPCKCPLPCFSFAYDSKLSTATWPSGQSYFNSFCSTCHDNDEELQIVRQSQGKLKVYYSTLKRTIYEQKEMFQDSELFSHLGGQMGLWLGLSIVAAFELLENVIFICKYCATSSSCTKKE